MNYSFCNYPRFQFYPVRLIELPILNCLNSLPLFQFYPVRLIAGLNTSNRHAFMKFQFYPVRLIGNQIWMHSKNTYISILSSTINRFRKRWKITIPYHISILSSTINRNERDQRVYGSLISILSSTINSGENG